MTPNDRLKAMVRRKLMEARDSVIQCCPECDAQRRALEHLNKALENAGKAIDGIDTRSRVLVPGR